MGKPAVVASLALWAAAGLALAAPAGPRSTGQHRDQPDGMLVLAVNPPERAVVADPRTGATSTRRLAGGTLCHGPLLAVGDRVILSGSRRGRPVALSLPLTLRGHARSLGPADTFTGSPTPGRLWLGRRTTGGVGAPPISLREANPDGRVVARTSEVLPSWGGLEAVTDDGFLSTGRRGLTLRRPFERGQRSFRDGWLIAAGRTRFAWCRGDCRRLRLWSRGGGRTLDPPAGLRPFPGGRAAISADGRVLAVPVQTRHGTRVGVIDLASDTWSVVPGAKIAGYWSIAWSPSGRWLYFTGAKRLFAWQPGSARPRRLPIRLGGTVMSIATVQGPRRPR